MRNLVHLDYETRCELDIKKVGLRRYVAHPSFEVLLTAWADRRGPVQQCEGFTFPVQPHDLAAAFNAPFERAVAERMGTRVQRWTWLDVMSFAYARGFSGDLDAVGKQVGIPQDQQKLSEGGRLISKFCKPRRPSKDNPDRYWTKETKPEDWERFCTYNRQDVEAERAIYDQLDQIAPWTRSEQELWVLDQQINQRGLPIDTDLAAQAIIETQRQSRALEARCKELTGGIGPARVAALLKWCQDRGYLQKDLQRATLLSIERGDTNAKTNNQKNR